MIWIIGEHSQEALYRRSLLLVRVIIILLTQGNLLIESDAVLLEELNNIHLCQLEVLYTNIDE